jgi:hypothetical protein
MLRPAASVLGALPHCWLSVFAYPATEFLFREKRSPAKAGERSSNRTETFGSWRGMWSGGKGANRLGCAWGCWDASELEPFSVEPPSLSLLLWQRARDVRLWAMVPAAHRTGLFQENAPSSVDAGDQVPAALRTAIEVLQSLVDNPGEADRESLAEACRCVIDWAEKENVFPVALHFADSWGYVESHNPQTAATAGQYCTRGAHYGRAEEWLIRAATLGRRVKDWEWYIRSYVRLGIVRYELGDSPRARAFALKAATKAKWSGHHTLGGMAYHDLLAVAIHTGTFAQGERYATRALELYPVRYDRVRHLAHDYALFLARRACYSSAMPLLNGIEPLFGPEDPMRSNYGGSRGGVRGSSCV